MLLNSYAKKGKDGFGLIGLTVILLVVILAVAFAVYVLFFGPGPLVKGTEAFEYLPVDKTIVLKGENLKSIEVFIYQEGKTVELLKDLPEASEKTYELRVRPGDVDLSNGQAVVVVKAKAGIFKKVRYEIKATVDTEPPVIEVLMAPFTVHRGSAGFALLSARDAVSVYIKLGDRTFPAFEVESVTDPEDAPSGLYGSEQHIEENRLLKRAAKTYYVFFAVPFDIESEGPFYAVASDAAGNQDVSRLSTRINIRKYQASSIEIDENFINNVVAPLLNKTSVSDAEGAFKEVNEEWRQQSRERIIDISCRTEPRILWEGRFLQLRNSKVMAKYGDERTYLYKGKKISESVHLGYDLASFAHAPVEAANTGIVKFAGDLGIYGNTVLIDHGLGVMSLYGHLSSIAVEEGQTVNKGKTIGRTGATGLAGGDHLHFGMLVHGHEVSPLYWWDPNWLRLNILDYID